MFLKKKRVTKELFQAIMKQGRTLSGSLFSFRYIKQKEPQYAFVVPKSVEKQAVSRNKLRRVGYNALKTHNPESCAGIFFFKKEAKKANFNEIKLDLKAILEKAQIS